MYGFDVNLQCLFPPELSFALFHFRVRTNNIFSFVEHSHMSSHVLCSRECASAIGFVCPNAENCLPLVHRLDMGHHVVLSCECGLTVGLVRPGTRKFHFLVDNVDVDPK